MRADSSPRRASDSMKQSLLIGVVAIALAPLVARAQVDARDAWARPAVAGQAGTGAFMSLRSAEGARIVGAASAVAGATEIHEMKMDGNVMRMRAVPVLDLPPGQLVELKPGGFHVMLMNLNRPLAAGEKFTIELRVERKDKSLATQPVEVEVRAAAPTPPTPAQKR
jgi:copper(I)-binding protein